MKGNRSKAALTAVKARSLAWLLPRVRGCCPNTQYGRTGERTWAAVWKADTRGCTTDECIDRTKIRSAAGRTQGTPMPIGKSRSSARPALQTEVLER